MSWSGAGSTATAPAPAADATAATRSASPAGRTSPSSSRPAPTTPAGEAAHHGAPRALVALVARDVGMERQAKTGTVWPWVLIAMVCSLLVGVAQAVRVDARAATLKKLESAAQLENMSDRQIDDETKSAERLYQVVRVAGGLADAPLSLGLSCLAVVGLTWFLRGRVKGASVVPVAAATLLPGSIPNLLGAGAGFHQPPLSPN